MIALKNDFQHWAQGDPGAAYATATVGRRALGGGAGQPPRRKRGNSPTTGRAFRESFANVIITRLLFSAAFFFFSFLSSACFFFLPLAGHEFHPNQNFTTPDPSSTPRPTSKKLRRSPPPLAPPKSPTMSDLSVKLTAPNGLSYTQPTGLFINGEFCKAAKGGTITSIDPACVAPSSNRETVRLEPRTANPPPAPRSPSPPSRPPPRRMSTAPSRPRTPRCATPPGSTCPGPTAGSSSPSSPT